MRIHIKLHFDPDPGVKKVIKNIFLKDFQQILEVLKDNKKMLIYAYLIRPGAGFRIQRPHQKIM